jgi:hypothetical protein
MSIPVFRYPPRGREVAVTSGRGLLLFVIASLREGMPESVTLRTSLSDGLARHYGAIRAYVMRPNSTRYPHSIHRVIHKLSTGLIPYETGLAWVGVVHDIRLVSVGLPFIFRRHTDISRGL